MGEGGEFYQPLAVAIIGGTITSTLLTLLVVPTFYDSIEIARDRMFAKFQRRLQARHVAIAFATTFVEAILTLLGIRALWRGLLRLRQNGWRRGWHPQDGARRAVVDSPRQRRGAVYYAN